MKQVLQHLRTGAIELAEVPSPKLKPGHLLVRTRTSLISPGTERMLVEFGQAGLVAKARSQPERVRQVLAKLRTDGVQPTLEAVFAKLDEPLPLGYCNVGSVLEVGSGATGFSPGDRVVSNGAHAEVVCVPANLSCRVPAGVDDDAAAFTVLGAIALNGVRLLQPTLGEAVVVFGLGLLGQLAVQLLRAHGCRVLGVDLDPGRCELARSAGAETACPREGVDPLLAAASFSRGQGVDGVLITASAKRDDIVHQSAEMCRKRGRIVLVGVVDLGLQRGDFYGKELSFQVACSYGPGRYDPVYEEEGRDYPQPYVRWTAARNFGAVLDLIDAGRLDLRPLISRRLAQRDAESAYDAVVRDPAVLGVVMRYVEGEPHAVEARTVAVSPRAETEQGGPAARVVSLVERRLARGGAAGGEDSRPSLEASPGAGRRCTRIGVVGSGAFAKQVLMPAIRAAGGEIRAVASAGGVSGLHAARKFGAGLATTDWRTMLADPDIDAVVIATRHDAHASMAAEALAAGKHVFVEKPLAIDEAGLAEVRAAHAVHAISGGLQLTVGFNRRFAPHAVRARELLARRSAPLAMILTVNAGAIPADHWTQDPLVGGGRVVGEGCHFVDLALFLVGRPIVSVSSTPAGVCSDGHSARGDSRLADVTSVTLGFADGSIATIHYLANGPRSFPKERVEVFVEGRALAIDNWRALELHGFGRARGLRSLVHGDVTREMRIRQDKGHRAEMRAFLSGLAGGRVPVPFADLEMVTRASFAAAGLAPFSRPLPAVACRGDVR